MRRQRGKPSFEALWQELGWAQCRRPGPRVKVVVVRGLDWYPRPELWPQIEILRWRPERSRKPTMHQVWLRTLWRGATLAVVLFPLGPRDALRQTVTLARAARARRIPLVLIGRWPATYEPEEGHTAARRALAQIRPLASSLLLVGPDWFGPRHHVFGLQDVHAAWSTILHWLAHGLQPRLKRRAAKPLGLSAVALGWGAGTQGLTQGWREAWQRAVRFGMIKARAYFVHAMMGPEWHPRDLRNTLETWMYEQRVNQPFFWSAQVVPELAGRARVLLVASGLATASAPAARALAKPRAYTAPPLVG